MKRPQTAAAQGQGGVDEVHADADRRGGRLGGRNPRGDAGADGPLERLHAVRTRRGAFLAGEGLQESATATTIRLQDDGQRVVTDGPFAETKEQVGGFYLLECDNLDEALDWAKKVPLRAGAIEVRPVMDYEAFGAEEPAAAEASS